MAHRPRGATADFEEWSFVGYPLAGLIDDHSNLAGCHQVWWIAHVASFFLFVVILPVTMLRHIFTSPLNMYLRDRERPKGAMKPMPNLMETELESFGASTVEDFTWKQLLDTDACTMCGRCTSVCPAHATGKPLDPREIVLKTGEVMARTGTPAVSPPLGVDPEITVERQQPLRADHLGGGLGVHLVQGVRRDLPGQHRDPRQDPRHAALPVAHGERLPDRAGQRLPGDGELGEPVGPVARPTGRRGPARSTGVPIVEPGDPFDHEYLYWVGCAGSLRRQEPEGHHRDGQAAPAGRASTSPSSGRPRQCTGDPARRSGNEYIFQMLAMANIESLNGMGVKKIITQCPHCFNTLLNEYPQLGGHFEVVHHSQLLEELIESGRLDLTDARLDERVVYHDSCYLGRHNDVYLSPRNVIGSLGGIEVVEAERNGTKGMCCGAGGARMWMEESIGTKVNDARAEELIATGASKVATACPFCYIMLDDGVKGAGAEETVQVADISMHLLAALEAADERATPELQTLED